MNKFLLSLLVCIAVTGCSNSRSRMYDCMEQGVSRDACYVAEQNRQSAINSAAEKQAMENAQGLYSSDNGSSHHHKHH